jgi:ketosteroid isomerase-like protein
MKAEQSIETEVRSTLDQLLELYKQGDFEEWINLFSADPDVTTIGTRAASKQIGRESIIEHFKNTSDLVSKITSLSYENLLVSAEGSISWISTDMNIEFATPDETMKIFARLTAVLQNQNNIWKIAQLHISIPAA